MPNQFDYRCPKCRSAHGVEIMALSWQRLEYNGTNADVCFEGTTWEDDFEARCFDCDFYGTVADFDPEIEEHKAPEDDQTEMEFSDADKETRIKEKVIKRSIKAIKAADLKVDDYVVMRDKSGWKVTNIVDRDGAIIVTVEGNEWPPIDPNTNIPIITVEEVTLEEIQADLT
jgi:hypothetical protein